MSACKVELERTGTRRMAATFPAHPPPSELDCIETILQEAVEIAGELRSDAPLKGLNQILKMFSSHLSASTLPQQLHTRVVNMSDVGGFRKWTLLPPMLLL